MLSQFGREFWICFSSHFEFSSSSSFCAFRNFLLETILKKLHEKHFPQALSSLPLFFFSPVENILLGSKWKLKKEGGSRCKNPPSQVTKSKDFWSMNLKREIHLKVLLNKHLQKEQQLYGNCKNKVSQAWHIWARFHLA